jgi:hypothetical protein
MITKKKLTPKQVALYEKVTGIKTTGDVTLHTIDNELWAEYEKLVEPKEQL